MDGDEVLTLVSLVRVTPRQFPKGVTISKLPGLLDRAIGGVAASGVSVGGYYLVPGEYATIRRSVNRLAVPYHDYAVEVLGEKCTQEGCDKHAGLAHVVTLFGRGGS